MPLPFLIVRDHKENKKKCTLSPLLGREGFEFIDLPHPERARGLVEIHGGILLSPDGPELRAEDAQLLADETVSREGRVIVLDSTWARVPKVLERLRLTRGERLVTRSLPTGLRTAYPRRSKLYEDPHQGLASIEAVFAAAVILGQGGVDVLAEYRWGEDFVQLNRLTLGAMGWDPRSPRGHLDQGE